ncbi:hypothetical protein GOM49_14325 [Clostridium bovifaecis]|uniref:Uncharacterized protein n=1 Tax=Clostridium bovifaecis TaxID=2184719 RepID=A0A6I6F0S7_9CLOT|nr:hypothetical protein GOM49_14325 [Clostridium bovifaecis]
MKIKLYVGTKDQEYRPITKVIEIDDNELKVFTEQGREDQYINEKAWDYVSKNMIRWTWDVIEENKDSILKFN